MNRVIIKAENLRKSYSIEKREELSVLNGLSVEFREGEFSAVVGPSGAGKSTLLYLLGALETPDSGEITLDVGGEKLVYSLLDDKALTAVRRDRIGFVFQFHHLLPEFTALENVMIPAMIAGKSQSKAKEIAFGLLERVGVAARSAHKPSELSGGEQQRIAMARALVNKPDLVLADEPTGNLDAKNTESVMNLIEELQREFSLTFIVATHSERIAAKADRFLELLDGNIRA